MKYRNVMWIHESYSITINNQTYIFIFFYKTEMEAVDGSHRGKKHFWLFCSILALLWREHCDIFGPAVWHIVKWHLSYPLGVNEVFLTPRSTALTSMQTFFVTANVKIYVNILISDFYVQTVLRIEMAHSSLVNLIRDATIVIYDSRIVMTANL